MDQDSIIFPVSLLYIQLDVNVGVDEKKKEPNIHLFKRSMLKMPKMDTQPILTSEFPFFTKNVRYPTSIESAEWRIKYEFFFNRALFVSRLRKEIGDNRSIYKVRLTPDKGATEEEKTELYEWMIETEKHNMMVTLRALFPIPEYFSKTLKDSYRNVLMNKSNTRVLTDLNILSTVNVMGFMHKFGIINKKKEEYFINIRGKQYAVNDVIWKNDIINHPIYSQFLASQRETYEEVAKSAEDVEEKYDIYFTKLKDELIALKDTERMQKDFYKIINNCNEEDLKCQSDMFEFFKKTIQKSDESTFDKLVKSKEGGYNHLVQYLLHHYYFTEYYEKYNNADTTDTNIKGFIDMYGKINSEFKYNEYPNYNKSISADFKEEVEFLYEVLYDTDPDFKYDNVDEYISDKLIPQMRDDLKVESLFMLRNHILSKAKTANSRYDTRFNVNIDRINTANSVVDKFDRLSKETGEIAVDIILSIREDFDNHHKLHSGEGVNIFMEREYELVFDRLLKMAIDTKAASIVLRFAKNNIPMNLSDKKPDGSDISQVNKRINQHIRDYFGTEASINNQLSSNVNNVFEPVRKTSNRELYKVLKLFKLGDAIIKREYKMSDVEVDRERKVLETAYDKFVQNKKINTEQIESYLYTGVDEVKSTEDANANVRRNVYEVYVGIDLVNPEFYGKSSCKLTDKEMEQELYYLIDPRNKTYNVLSKFRDFSGDNDNKEAIKETEKNKEPVKEKKTGGKQTRRIRDNQMNRTKRNII